MSRFLLYSFLVILNTPFVALATTKYAPLVEIPGNLTLNGNFSDYVNFLYATAIGIAALLAVVKIIVAGVKYMTSEVVSAKGNAKNEIVTALLGLLLIIGAYLILNTINPQLTKQSFNFKELPPPPDLKQSVAPPENPNIPKAPNMNACAVQRTSAGSNFIRLDTAACAAAGVDVAAEEAKFRDWCKTTVKGSLTSNGNYLTCNPDKVTTSPDQGGGVTLNFSVGPIEIKPTVTGYVYVFNSSQYGNDPNVMNAKIQTFLDECKTAKGTPKRGGSRHTCTVTK